jgi:hypothetical protein
MTFAKTGSGQASRKVIEKRETLLQVSTMGSSAAFLPGKKAIFAPFCTQNDQFTKTGSGRT